MDGLDALFRPRSVAIVGASSDPNKVGGRPLAFLRKAGWTGRILPVNPAPQVQGIPAYASLDAIDGSIDQAIVAVPAAQVMATAQRCVARGVRALQIFSSGFGEGSGAADAQLALKALAARSGARILGPNSLGLFNVAEGFFGTFATALDGAWPRSGGIGVATQSGAFGSYFFGMAQQAGLGFSHFVATGNEADVDVADCVQFLARDPHTRLLVIALEGCRDGRKLARALRDAHAAGKPVLAMKVGVSDAGAQAAASHTGALAGSDRVFDAVLRDCGARRAQSLQELVDAACVASAGPLPRGRELLVVTTSGGIGVLSADAAAAASLSLPWLSQAARRDILASAPLAEGRNPVDTSAGILADLSAYARIAARALDDRPFDAVLCYLAHIPRNPAHWAQLREPLFALRARHPQCVFAAVALAGATVTEDLRTHGFAVFTDPASAIKAIAACVPRPLAEAPAQAQDTPALASVPRTEADAKRELARRGIRFAPERVVADADQAVDAAACLGYPVVLKIVSPDIAHKTEAGGVQLAIADAQELRRALPAMRERVRQHAPSARIEGFLVARQLDAGVEVLVGTRRDPVFGPVVTIGSGGVLAELLDDVCVRLAPVSAASARQMLLATRAARLLQGWRGAPPADLDALAAQVALLSQIGWTERERIDAIELNPMLARADGAYALDALVEPAGETA